MKRMREVINELLDDDLTPGDYLRGKRIEANLSQDDLAQITGISRPNISALENGRIGMTNRYAEIFSVAINIHPAEILYPNNKLRKSKELKEIENRAKNFKRA